MAQLAAWLRAPTGERERGLVAMAPGPAPRGAGGWVPATPKPARRSSIREPILALRDRNLARTSVTGLLYNWGFFTVLGYAPFLMGAVTVLAGAVLLSTVRAPLAAADADEALPGHLAARDEAIGTVSQVPGLPEEAIIAGADLAAEGRS